MMRETFGVLRFLKSFGSITPSLLLLRGEKKDVKIQNKMSFATITAYGSRHLIIKVIEGNVKNTQKL